MKSNWRIASILLLVLATLVPGSNQMDYETIIRREGSKFVKEYDPVIRKALGLEQPNLKAFRYRKLYNERERAKRQARKDIATGKRRPRELHH